MFLKARLAFMHRRASYYYVSQLLVLAMPFLLVPFLARVVGPVGLGLYGIGQSIALIVSTAVDYGFQLNGARHVAQNRNDNAAISLTVEGVLATKCMMSILCLIVGSALAWAFVPEAMAYRIVILSLALGIFQGNNFYWYFGGVDRLVLAGTIDFLAKLTSLVGVFLLVRMPSDLWLVFLIQCMGQIVAVAWSLLLIFRFFGSPFWPNWARGVSLLRENFEVTVRSAVSMVYTGTTVLVMGIVSPAGAVGFLSGAERIVRGAILPMAPLRQTFFPSISAKAACDPVSAAASVRRLLFVTVGVNFSVMLIFIVFADPIVRIALGQKFLPSINALRILSAWPLLSGIAEVIGTLWLIPLRFDWASTKIVFLTAPVHIGGVLILSRLWQEIGAALAMEISALFALFMLASFVIRRTPLFQRREQQA